MQKLDPKSLVADWSILSYRSPKWSVMQGRPPWEHVTSMELSKVLGKHLQTVSNWAMRGILPPPVANNSRLRGNKNYYRISSIQSWLEGRSEYEIVKEWVEQDMEATLTDGQVRNLLQTLYKAPHAIS